MVMLLISAKSRCLFIYYLKRFDTIDVVNLGFSMLSIFLVQKAMYLTPKAVEALLIETPTIVTTDDEEVGLSRKFIIIPFHPKHANSSSFFSILNRHSHPLLIGLERNHAFLDHLQTR